MNQRSVNQITVQANKRLRWRKFKPRFPERIKDANDNYFAAIRYKDMIIHHPYESFDVVVKFLRQAARDKKVLVIDDVLTAGTAIKGALNYLNNNDAKLIAALVAFDREEKDENGNSYRSNLNQEGVKVYSIAKFSDLNL